MRHGVQTNSALWYADLSGADVSCVDQAERTVIWRTNNVNFNFSVFTGERQTSTDVSELGEVLDSALRSLGEADRWDVSTDSFWCRVTPNKQLGQSQGW